MLSNLSPRAVVDMVAAAEAGDYKKARAAHLSLFPLVKAIFIETNPVPVKRAMYLVKIGGLACDLSAVRLPLTSLTPDNEAKLRAALQNSKLL